MEVRCAALREFCFMCSVLQRTHMLLKNNHLGTKHIKVTLFRTVVIGAGSRQGCATGERLGSILNTGWASGNLWPRGRVRSHGWRIGKRKHCASGRFWLITK